jgi:hypothetical protein
MRQEGQGRPWGQVTCAEQDVVVGGHGSSVDDGDTAQTESCWKSFELWGPARG